MSQTFTRIRAEGFPSWRLRICLILAQGIAVAGGLAVVLAVALVFQPGA